MRRTLGIVIGVLSVLVLGCGGDESVGPKKRVEREAKDGRIFVDNAMGQPGDPERYDAPNLWVVVVYEDEEGNTKTHETLIELGKKKEVTGGDLIKGGTEVAITIRTKRWGEFENKEKVKVDGNVVIRVTGVKKNIGFHTQIIYE